MPELAVAGRSESKAAFTLPGVRGASAKAAGGFFIGVFNSPKSVEIFLEKPLDWSYCSGSASSPGFANILY